VKILHKIRYKKEYFKMDPKEDVDWFNWLRIKTPGWALVKTLLNLRFL
jgi:hypothetical protein